METDYGYVKYIYETRDAITVYVYDIQDMYVKAAILDGRPYLSLMRYTKEGRAYFLKENHRVYIDELEELRVIWGMT